MSLDAYLSALTVFFHWLILVALNNFMFILSSIVLLIFPSSFFAEVDKTYLQVI